MILFWIICAVMVVIALAFVLPPLLTTPDSNAGDDASNANVDVYRHQITELETDLRNGLISDDQFQSDKDEIERRLLEDVSTTQGPGRNQKAPVSQRGLVYTIALAIPIVAVGLYLQVGSTAANSRQPLPPVAAAPESSGPMTQQRIEANVAALAKRLEENPTDVQGWSMLGRSYVSMERFADASNAFSKAAALKPDDADVLSDYAFALAMANGQQFQGKPQELIDKAIRLDPENPKALELAGSAAFYAKNYKDAVNYWQRLLAKAPAESELAQSLTERIERAKALAGTK